MFIHKKNKLKHYICKDFIVCFLLLMICCNFPQLGWASPGSTVNLNSQQNLILQTAEEQLNILHQQTILAERNLKIVYSNREKKLQELNPSNISENLMAQASMTLANANATLNDVNLSLLDVERAINTTNAAIDNLMNSLRDAALLAAESGESTRVLLADLRKKISFQKSLLRIETSRANLLKKSRKIAEENLSLQQDWYDQLNLFYQIQQDRQHRQQTQKTIAHLQAEQQKWLNQVNSLTLQLEKLPLSVEKVDPERNHKEIAIFAATEHANLIHTQISLAQEEDWLNELQGLNRQPKTLATLNNANKRASLILASIQNIKGIISKRIELLQERLVLINLNFKNNLIPKSDFNNDDQSLRNLIDDYQIQLIKCDSLLQGVSSYQSEAKKQLTHELARRQGLPGLNLLAWTNLGKQLLTIPTILIQTLSGIWDQILYIINTLSYELIIFLSSVAVAWLITGLLLKRYLKLALKSIKKVPATLTARFTFIFLELIKRNYFELILFAAAISLALVAGLPYESFEIILLLISIWFIFKTIIQLSRIILIELPTTVTKHNIRLYYGLLWTFLFGGVLTGCMLLTHQLPVPYEVRDFFNRLFMLFLLVMSLLLVRGWAVVPSLLAPSLRHNHRYLWRIVRLLSLLIPLTLLSTAIIGLLGYVDLAWAINKHEGIFLLVLTGYILIRGTLMDFIEWLSEFSVGRVRNGWLWQQALLKPLGTILRMLAIMSGIVIIFAAYGWGRDSIVMKQLMALAHHKLFVIANSVITFISIIEFIVVVVIFAWATRWSREFAYRWLFAKVNDIGLRNSLAIFTQYTMVIIGFFVLLWVLGISLAALGAVATVIAVGFTFGLQDILRNYVNGIFLLLERPIRKGDYISIGGYEGEVNHIGHRSITISTWDHMEVLVPNSEAFEKPFTNWTLQDNIVRTLIPIKINRVDDPYWVRDLIMEVLVNCSSVLSDPEPQVLMKELEDALIEIQVRYCINLQDNPSRAIVRSEILFKIWDIFKANNIQPPYPQSDIYVKSFPK